MNIKDKLKEFDKVLTKLEEYNIRMYFRQLFEEYYKK